jgi:hypothetical protein
MPADRHDQISPFMISPHRRFTVPRLGLLGIHGIVAVVFGSAFSASADLLLLVHSRQAEGQTQVALDTLGVHLAMRMVSRFFSWP